jgi:xanthine dehydrogenase iron-sulfur cluster and FAD-binding subunit A
MPDYYNFDIKDWSQSTYIRNLGTIGGRILNMDPMGMAKGYTINFVGTATIGGN